MLKGSFEELPKHLFDSQTPHHFFPQTKNHRLCLFAFDLREGGNQAKRIRDRMVRRSLIADYSRTRVPADQTVSGLRVALIQISTGITLPAFLTGSEIGHGLGLARATLAFLIGGLLLGRSSAD